MIATFPRRAALLCSLLIVGTLTACSMGGDPAVPIGSFSRGQISFGSLSFTSAKQVAYTTASPLAQGSARGLGNDRYEVELTADWELVLACVNGGSNLPQGVVNYPTVSVLGATGLVSTSRNGVASFVVDSSPGERSAAELALERLALAPADVCPNANYRLSALGARYHRVSLLLWAPGTRGTPDAHPVDVIDFVCSDPAAPSSTTCLPPSPNEASPGGR